MGRLSTTECTYLPTYLWSSAGVTNHGVADPRDAVPLSTLVCPAGLVLAGLRVVCL